MPRGRPKQTHCKRGHELTEDNVYLYPNGKTRQCRKCKSEHTIKSPESYRKELEKNKENNRKRKFKVLTHYGPDGHLGCCWKGCFIGDIDMLSLDHINNDGAKHRKELNNGVDRKDLGCRVVYRDVEDRGFPPGFQTLCFNHQMKKQFNLRKIQN